MEENDIGKITEKYIARPIRASDRKEQKIILEK